MKSDFKRFRRLRRMATMIGFGGLFLDFTLGCWLGNSVLALSICLPVAVVVMSTWLAVSWSAYDCLVCPKSACGVNTEVKVEGKGEQWNLETLNFKP